MIILSFARHFYLFRAFGESIYVIGRFPDYDIIEIAKAEIVAEDLPLKL